MQGTSHNFERQHHQFEEDCKRQYLSGEKRNLWAYIYNCIRTNHSFEKMRQSLAQYNAEVELINLNSMQKAHDDYLKEQARQAELKGQPNKEKDGRRLGLLDGAPGGRATAGDGQARLRAM